MNSLESQSVGGNVPLCMILNLRLREHIFDIRFAFKKI